MSLMSINLFTGEKYWRVAIGVDRELGEEELKKVIVTIEQSLRRIYPNANMPRRKAVRRLFGNKD